MTRQSHSAASYSAASYSALCANDPELSALRRRLREFLEADQAQFGWQPSVDAWLSCWDEQFSARLGDAGFLGLTIPREYGGHGLGHLHRYVVTEELLACGAPVAAHWIADRQVGPGLLSYGNEEQRRRILPRIAAGRFFSAIGMSEPQAGSDLAAATAKAVRTVRRRPVISSWSALIAYVKVALAHEPREQFRLLFLDKKNQLIADEVMNRGTVDHAPVYPREVARRALELSASALILVHNHPSGDPTPSSADIDMTRQVKSACDVLRIAVHDHLVVGRDGVASFKALGLI